MHRVRVVVDEFAMLGFVLRFHRKSKLSPFILLLLVIAKKGSGDRESCCISKDLSSIEVSTPVIEVNGFDICWADCWY